VITPTGSSPRMTGTVDRVRFGRIPEVSEFDALSLLVPADGVRLVSRLTDDNAFVVHCGGSPRGLKYRGASNQSHLTAMSLRVRQPSPRC
jgi:hypothetical protein